jgi:acetylornithine/succinyldiaminopimelate/putrescine aminotransferase
MWGIELDRDASEIQKKLLQKGFVVGTSRSNVLRLLPPFVITRPALKAFLAALAEVLDETTAPSKEKSS